jgi:hypothetical protein
LGVAAAGIRSVEDQYRRHKPIVVRIEDNWVQGSDVGTPWGHVGSVDQACTKLSHFTYLNNTFQVLFPMCCVWWEKRFITCRGQDIDLVPPDP